MPGRQPMGLAPTTLVGMIGALAGGLLGNLVVGRELLALHPAGFIGSVIGALIVLALLGLGARRVWEGEQHEAEGEGFHGREETVWRNGPVFTGAR